MRGGRKHGPLNHVCVQNILKVSKTYNFNHLLSKTELGTVSVYFFRFKNSKISTIFQDSDAQEGLSMKGTYTG